MREEFLFCRSIDRVIVVREDELILHPDGGVPYDPTRGREYFRALCRGEIIFVPSTVDCLVIVERERFE